MDLTINGVVNARVVSEVVEVIEGLGVDLDSEEDVGVKMMIKMEEEEIVLVEEVVVAVVVLSESLMILVMEKVKDKVLERALEVEMKMVVKDVVSEIKEVLVAIDSVVDVEDLEVVEVEMIEVEEDLVAVAVGEDSVDVVVVTVVGVVSIKIDTLVMTQIIQHLRTKKLNLMTSKYLIIHYLCVKCIKILLFLFHLSFINNILS